MLLWLATPCPLVRRALVSFVISGWWLIAQPNVGSRFPHFYFLPLLRFLPLSMVPLLKSRHHQYGHIDDASAQIQTFKRLCHCVRTFVVNPPRRSRLLFWKESVNVFSAELKPSNLTHSTPVPWRPSFVSSVPQDPVPVSSPPPPPTPLQCPLHLLVVLAHTTSFNTKG